MTMYLIKAHAGESANKILFLLSNKSPLLSWRFGLTLHPLGNNKLAHLQCSARAYWTELEAQLSFCSLPTVFCSPDYILQLADRSRHWQYNVIQIAGDAMLSMWALSLHDSVLSGSSTVSLVSSSARHVEITYWLLYFFMKWWKVEVLFSTNFQSCSRHTIMSLQWLLLPSLIKVKATREFIIVLFIYTLLRNHFNLLSCLEIL